MIRIGIIGSENTHALKFSELANGTDGAGRRVSGIAVTMLYGDDRSQAEDVAKQGDVPYVVDHPSEMLGEIDAVMVTTRHGDRHAALALPFIKAGIPTFVDKPFAISLSDCRQMVEAAKTRGTLLTSYSTLRYTDVVKDLQNRLTSFGELVSGVSTGPCDFTSQYGGPFFYGTHAIEVMLAVFGYDVKSVTARKVGPDCVAVIEFESGVLVSLHLLDRAAYAFHLVIYGMKAWESVPIDLASCYVNGLQVFVDMVKTGHMPLSYEQLLVPIEVLHKVATAAGEFAD